jgi:hypothetical protein
MATASSTARTAARTTISAPYEPPRRRACPTAIFAGKGRRLRWQPHTMAEENPCCGNAWNTATRAAEICSDHARRAARDVSRWRLPCLMGGKPLCWSDHTGVYRVACRPWSLT